MAANKVARALGIDLKGKTLAQVVGEIDARYARAGGTPGAAPGSAESSPDVPAGLRRTTAAQLDTPAQGVLANATTKKKAAFERVETLRSDEGRPQRARARGEPAGPDAAARRHQGGGRAHHQRTGAPGCGGIGA